MFIPFMKKFYLRQNGRSINDYFTILKEKCDELTTYHPIITDAIFLKQQREEFHVANILSRLDDSLSHVR